MRFYAGIGSRETPPECLHLAGSLATRFREAGWILRSGHAPGADQAFERGAGAIAELFLPWKGFERDTPLSAGLVLREPKRSAYEVAARYHPAWENLLSGARALHARNCHQILGTHLDNPVTLVVCWTPEGKEVGGTAQAMRIARAKDIPIYNLALPEDFQRLVAREDFPN